MELPKAALKVRNLADLKEQKMVDQMGMTMAVRLVTERAALKVGKWVAK
jgi:hypothetical protein